MTTEGGRTGLRTLSRKVAADRPFRLLDAMILIAATATGLAVIRGIQGAEAAQVLSSELQEVWADYRTHRLSTFHIPDATLGYSMAMTWLILEEFGIALPLVWTLALIPLRLIHPRPSFRHLGRQPGFLAALAVGASSALVVLSGILTPVFRPAYPIWYTLISGGIALMPTWVACAVLGSWITLVVSGRWRAELSWLDRMGRILGFFWVGAGLTTAVCFTRIV